LPKELKNGEFSMRIKKELFCEIIELTQKQEKRDEEISEAMSNYTNSFVSFGHTTVKEALMRLLREVMGDTDDFIGWWLYEDVEKKVWLKDGTEISLLTVGELYDFLCTNC
jgi:hypothetical protein